MHEHHWRDIMDQLRCLPDQRQASIQCGGVTLRVERHGGIWVAMREVPEHLANDPACLRAVAEDTSWQLLRIQHTHYLCEKRREMGDWRLLQSLADYRFPSCP